MPSSLSDWNAEFESAFSRIARKDQAGALLSVIPSREDWEKFLTIVKSQWRFGQVVQSYRHCLIVLYDGVAFYEYEGGRFWNKFAEAVGLSNLPANEQSAINGEFAYSAQELGLRVFPSDYNGSAVYHIGIPISLWESFLKICEWALWHDEWRTFKEHEWTKLVESRLPGQTRLKNFVKNNPKTATEFIDAILAARTLLTEDENIDLEDIKQSSILRREYFDEVPETARFLRPQNPESLYKHRVKLIFDEQREQIRLDLPPIKYDDGIWRIGETTKHADRNGTSISLNSKAFAENLRLVLEYQDKIRTINISGLKPFGLFDEELGRFVDPNRKRLPISRYFVVSAEPLIEVNRKNFDEDEETNEPFPLTDGTVCYVTRLSPTYGKTPSVSFVQGGGVKGLKFYSPGKIEAQIFVGEGVSSAFYYYFDDRKWLKTETLPSLCVTIPKNFSENNLTLLRNKFEIRVDNSDEWRANGEWKMLRERDNNEFYVWNWANKPFFKREEIQVLSSFQQLNPNTFSSREWVGKRIIQLRSSALNFDFSLGIELHPEKIDMSECWANMPGAMLPFFLLCQPSKNNQGLKLDEVWFAKEVIAPEHYFYMSALKLAESEGLVEIQNNRWKLVKSRVSLHERESHELEMNYTGDPSILWRLFRQVKEKSPTLDLPKIEIISKRKEIPFVKVFWQNEQIETVKRFLKNKREVEIAEDLWRN